MKGFGIILAIIVAFVSYKFYNIQVPVEAVDSFPTKLFLASFRLASLKVCVM